MTRPAVATRARRALRGARRVPADEWWRTSGAFFLLSETHRAGEGPKAAAFVDRVLSLAPGARVLDLGCGWGRVALELAARGHRVVGVDCSKVLRLAPTIARQRGVAVDWVRGDMRTWSSPPVFDAVLLWGMSFGYFSDEENREVLRRVAASLRPGGRLLLDLHHREWYLANYLGEHVELVQGQVLHDEATFDAATSRLNLLSTLADGKGKVLARQWYSFREYTPAEIVTRLQEAGLRLVARYANLDPHSREPGPSDSSWQVVAGPSLAARHPALARRRPP